MTSDSRSDHLTEETTAPIAERYKDLIADEFAEVRVGTGSVPPVRGETVTSGGGISSIRWGSGPPGYVLIHGAGLNAHSWDSVALLLDAPVIVPDLPGHGLSTPWDNLDLRPAQLAETLSELLLQERKPFALVGQSLGGLACIELAAANPQLVTSLTIVDITPSRSANSPGSRRIRDFIGAGESFASYEEIVDRALAFGMGKSRESLERGVIHNTRRNAQGRLVFRHSLAASPTPAQTAGFDATDLWQKLEKLQLPVQLVRGTQGIVDDGQIQEFRQRLPSSRIVTLQGGHNIQRDAPHELAQAVKEAKELAR